MNTNSAQDAHELERHRGLMAQTAKAWRDYVDGRADGAVMMGASARFRGLLDRLKTPPKRPKTLWIRFNEVRRAIRERLRNFPEFGPEFEFTNEEFFKGPPNSLPVRAGVDLEETPPPSPVVAQHLAAYLFDLGKRISQMQAQRNLTGERQLLDTRAMTFESLRAWEQASKDLQRVGDIDGELGDHVIAARTRLREGIALYRACQYLESRNVLNAANEILEKRIPRYCDVRTLIKVWDYLGLAHLRCGDATESLGWLEKVESIPKKLRVVTPLADASRLVRRGIAHLELRQITKARQSLIEGLTIRVKYIAHPELARGLRYLGLLHFGAGRWPQALCIWDLCLCQQQAAGNEAEEAKLRHHRADLLYAWAATGNQKSQHSIPAPSLAALFPDSKEAGLLKPLAEKFRPTQSYFRRQARFAAEQNYRACIEIAIRLGMLQWRDSAEKGLLALNGKAKDAKSQSLKK